MLVHCKLRLRSLGGSEISEKDLILLFALSMALAVVAVAAIAWLHLQLATALVLRITGATPIETVRRRA